MSRDADTEKKRRRYYWVSMLIMVVGSLVILSFVTGDMKALIDFAATIAFIGAPIFAVLNHRAILGAEVPAEARPALWLRIWSIAGIASLGGFALAYVYLFSIS